jgi:anthranilate/para-aminobenzoate synthase component I
MSSPSPLRQALPHRFSQTSAIDLARAGAGSERAALFQRFDLHSRQLTRSVVPLSMTRLDVRDLGDGLRRNLPRSDSDAPLLVFAGVEAVCDGDSTHTPPWLVYRLDRYLDIDHASGEAWACGVAADHIVTLTGELDARLRLRSTVQGAAAPASVPAAAWQQDVDESTHAERVRQVQQGLLDQGLHGALLSIGLSRATTADPFDVYAACVASNPSPYGYVLREGDFALIGSSPLAFLQLKNAHVHVETDAGTRPVTRDAQIDDLAEADLRINPKDAIEHQVVVDAELAALEPIAGDLVRTVVSREVRRFSHVMHLYSAFEAQLSANLDVVDAVRALAPAAAVSGHPKREAFALGCGIEQGERGPYGGLLGLISSPYDADLAVVIRSMWINKGVAHLRVGGKVVAGADPSAEYREAISKSTFLVNALTRAEATPTNPKGDHA